MNKLRIILGLLLAIAIVAGGVWWWQAREQSEEAAKVSQVTLQYQLRPGWTFIGLPIDPITVRYASELMDYMEQEGGYVLMVSRWDGDRWQEYAAVGDARYGEDFPLKVGEAYFISSSTEVTISIAGKTLPKKPTISLVPGWNAVVLYPSQFANALGVLDGAHQGDKETATEIDRWYSGNWQALVKRWYSPENIQEYGDNFLIEETAGYMIKANESVEIGK